MSTLAKKEINQYLDGEILSEDFHCRWSLHRAIKENFCLTCGVVNPSFVNESEYENYLITAICSSCKKEDM